jgi:hypothetical protein
VAVLLYPPNLRLYHPKGVAFSLYVFGLRLAGNCKDLIKATTSTSARNLAAPSGRENVGKLATTPISLTTPIAGLQWHLDQRRSFRFESLP